MTAGRYDFRCRQGDTLVATLTFRDGRHRPIDLAGAELRMQVKDRPGGALVLDCAPYLAVTDAAAGAARLEVPAEITATLPPTGVGGEGCGEGSLVYDLEIRDAAGSVFTWLAGQMVVTPEVTA